MLKNYFSDFMYKLFGKKKRTICAYQFLSNMYTIRK